MRCVKGVRIRSFSGPYFPAFGLNISPYLFRMWGNMDQKNPKYGPFSRSDGSYEANPTKEEKVSLSVQYNRDKQSLKMLKI